MRRAGAGHPSPYARIFRNSVRVLMPKHFGGLLTIAAGFKQRLLNGVALQVAVVPNPRLSTSLAIGVRYAEAAGIRALWTAAAPRAPLAKPVVRSVIAGFRVVKEQPNH